MIVRLNRSDIDHDGYVGKKSRHNARTGRQQRNVLERHLVQIGDGLPDGADVFVVDEPMEKVIV